MMLSWRSHRRWCQQLAGNPSPHRRRCQQLAESQVCLQAGPWSILPSCSCCCQQSIGTSTVTSFSSDPSEWSFPWPLWPYVLPDMYTPGRSSWLSLAPITMSGFIAFAPWFLPWRIHETWQLTWNLESPHLQRKIIFDTSIIVFHVNFAGCKKKQHRIHLHLLIFHPISFPTFPMVCLVRSPRSDHLPGPCLDLEDQGTVDGNQPNVGPRKMRNPDE